MKKLSETTTSLKPPPAIRVEVKEEGKEPVARAFTRSFLIGRDEDCDIVLTENIVSKKHVEITFEQGTWWITDLQSRNGIFKRGSRISREPITKPVQIVLGATGPRVALEIEGVEKMDPAQTIAPSITQYQQHYFAEKPAASAGEHTMLLRQAFSAAKKKQSWKFFKIIIALGALLLCVAIYAGIREDQVSKQEKLAQDTFYELKKLELAYDKLARHILSTGDSTKRPEVKEFLSKRQEMEDTYDRFISELGYYSSKLSPEERIIYRVARIFGECEVGMPDGFVKEVIKYVDLWKTSSRLRTAMQRAVDNGYPARIASALMANEMPPQFFYLALQESEFDSATCGPKTKYGIAKGMWQFIPSTAIQYGLKTGPLVQFPQPDPRDERLNVDLATEAAAHYIRDIYDTEAQASGLLVMASYNWGHNLVKSLIRKMPYNPRERNFWKFFTTYRKKIPKETYNYVFYIFSAAVIGENPKLFGFDFSPPFGTTVQAAQQ